MKKTKIILAVILIMFTLIGCSKKRPSEKFSGTYQVVDVWNSSVSAIGKGTLDYDLIITPDGDEGIMLMNVNKTFNGVRATVNDNTITIPSQTVSSVSGSSYTVNGYTGSLSEDGNLNITFVYSDALYGYAVGEVTCSINGSKQKSTSSK